MASTVENGSQSLWDKVLFIIFCVIHQQFWMKSKSIHSLSQIPKDMRTLGKEAGCGEKNRKPSSKKPSCIGTDLNRNFPDHWSMAGSSNNPCESIYHGAGPGSEAETRAILEVVRDLLQQPLIFILMDS